MVTPEIDLYRAMFDGIIKDSLAPPMGTLPDYTTRDTKCNEYIRTREKRKRMNNQEYWRSKSRDDIMSLYGEKLYYLCYKASIDSLRRKMRGMWDEVDRDPDMSKVFIKRFNNKAGNEKAGGRVADEEV